MVGILLNSCLKKWFAPLTPCLGFSNLMFLRMSACVRAHVRERESPQRCIELDNITRNVNLFFLELGFCMLTDQAYSLMELQETKSNVWCNKLQKSSL